MKFDHIGLFVESLEHGNSELEKLISISKKSEEYHDPLLQVSVQFLYDSSEICYELVAPFGADSHILSALKNPDKILNHVAYRTQSFDEDIKQLRESGCIPLGVPQPAIAFGGARVIFFLTPLRLILEIIEAPNG